MPSRPFPGAHQQRVRRSVSCLVGPIRFAMLLRHYLQTRVWRPRPRTVGKNHPWRARIKICPRTSYAALFTGARNCGQAVDQESRNKSNQMKHLARDLINSNISLAGGAAAIFSATHLHALCKSFLAGSKARQHLRPSQIVMRVTVIK